MSNLAQAYASVAAEDRTPFPIEDANTSCWGRGLMAGAIGTQIGLSICNPYFALVLTSCVLRYPSCNVHCLLQYPA